VHKQEHCPDRQADPKDPAANHKIARGRLRPEKQRTNNQHKQSRPLKSAPRFPVYVRIPPAGHANPALPETQRQNGNPENVDHIECPHLRRPPPFFAGQAVVIPKRQSPRAEMVNSRNNVHHNLNSLLPRVCSCLFVKCFSSMRARKMFVHYFPIFSLFGEHMRTAPADLMSSP
jgi:hypothetical protein